MKLTLAIWWTVSLGQFSDAGMPLQRIQTSRALALKHNMYCQEYFFIFDGKLNCKMTGKLFYKIRCSHSIFHSVNANNL